MEVKPRARLNENVQEEIIEAACSALSSNRSLRRAISTALLMGFDEAVDEVRREMNEKAKAIHVTGSALNISDRWPEFTVKTGSNSITINLLDHLNDGILKVRELTDPNTIDRILDGVYAFSRELRELRKALLRQQELLSQQKTQATRKRS